MPAYTTLLAACAIVQAQVVKEHREEVRRWPGRCGANGRIYLESGYVEGRNSRKQRDKNTCRSRRTRLEGQGAPGRSGFRASRRRGDGQTSQPASRMDLDSQRTVECEVGRKGEGGTKVRTGIDNELDLFPSTSSSSFPRRLPPHTAKLNFVHSCPYRSRPALI